MGRSKAQPQPRQDRFRSKDPADIAWRAEQAQVDADIEGLARDPEDERLMREMDAAGVPIEEQIDRMLRRLQDLQARKSMER